MHGAQRIVAREQVADRGAQQRRIEPRGEPHGYRPDLGRTAVLSPHPPRGGSADAERDAGRSTGRWVHRRLRLALAIQAVDQLVHRLGVEQVAHTHVDIGHRTDVAHQMGHQQ